jgi:restriction system protein
MLPVLKYVDANPRSSIASSREPMIELFSISQEDAEALLPSQRQTVLSNRLSWAFNHLYRAVLLERPDHGIYDITGRGKEVLQENPDRIGVQYLRRFPEYAEFIGRPVTASAEDGLTVPAPSGQSASGTAEGESSDDEASKLTPDEMLYSASDEFKARAMLDLRGEIKDMSHAAFEKLILEVMRGLGYGTKGSFKQTRMSRDGGIDGIITEDPLGLHSIYLQAKHFGEDETVSSKDLQAFGGAMHERGVDKGVFVTSGKFSMDAIIFAKNMHIRTINGIELLKIMYEKNIGVRRDHSVEVKRLDKNFFTDLKSFFSDLEG